MTKCVLYHEGAPSYVDVGVRLSAQRGVRDHTRRVIGESVGDESDRPRSVRVRSAAWLFSAQVLSLVISIPTSVLLARVLAPSGKGTLSVVQLVASFSAIVLNFGIGQALVYYSARREARGRDAIAVALLMGLAVSVGLGLLGLLFGRSLAALLNISPSWLVVVGLMATGPVLVGQYLNAHVVGRGSIRASSLVNVGSLALQLLVFAVLWAMGRLTAATAILVWTLAVTGVAVVFIGMSWSSEADEAVELGARSLMRRMWRYGLIAWPSGILGTAAQRIDVFLLTSIKGTAQVGIYSIAVTLAELCWYIPNALGGVLLPKVAAEREESLQVSFRLARVTWVATGLAAAAVAVVAPALVPLVFGRDFAGSVLPLFLILPGIIMSSAASAPAAYLSGIGKPIYGTIAAGVNVGVNVVANLLLIPRLGASGAALSSTISYSASAAILISVFVRKTDGRLRDILVPRAQDFREIYAAIRRALKSRGSNGREHPYVEP